MYSKICENIKAKIIRTPFDKVLYTDMMSAIKYLDQENSESAHIYSQWLRQQCEKTLPMANSADAKAYYNVWRATLLFDSRTSFDSYLRYVELDRKPNKRFYAPRAHYLKPMVQGFQDILDGKLRLLTISMPKRAGKALAMDTMLPTPDGFILMADVRIGTTLMGMDGKPTRVTDIFPQGSKPMYDILFDTGEKIRACKDHLWLVQRGNDKEYIVRDTSALYDFSMRSKTPIHIPYALPMEYYHKHTFVDPYLLGLFLSSGDYEVETHTPRLFIREPEVVDIVYQSVHDYDNVTFLENGVYGIYRTSGSMATDFALGLSRYGIHEDTDKYIPDDYIFNDIDTRLSVLAGILDTDSAFVDDHIEFITPHFTLADTMKLLVFSLGGKATIKYTTHEYPENIYEQSEQKKERLVKLSIWLPDGLIPYRMQSNVKTYKAAYESFRHRIVEIKYVGEHECQCLCVDNDEHMFCIGESYIPTHNSQTGINFVNMISGLYPDKSTLMEGTGDDLVKSFYSGCLEYLVKPSDYLYYDIFPESQLVQTNADTKIINLQQKSRFPTIMCRSIDARQVGLSEATNLLYLDDCVEGREEAKNRQRLDDKWEIISGDVMGRAIEGTPIVATGTRYSLYDPIGHLQEEAQKQGWEWRAIEIPALDPITDESNYEYIREGKRVFTTKYFREQRDLLSAEQFESEFQQQPFEAKGLLFNKDDLNYFFELPVDKEPDARIAYLDTAESGSDYTAMCIIYVYDKEYFVVDVVFDDSPAEITKPQCAKKLIEWNVSRLVAESNNAGSYYAKDVDTLIQSYGGSCSIQSKRTTANKQTKIEMASDGIKRSFFFKDWSKLDRKSQYYAFMKNVTTYTRTGKVPHDDAPDVLSMAENGLRNLHGGEAIPMKRLF